MSRAVAFASNVTSSVSTVMLPAAAAPLLLASVGAVTLVVTIIVVIALAVTIIAGTAIVVTIIGASCYAYVAGAVVEAISRAGQRKRKVDGIFDAMLEYMDMIQYPKNQRAQFFRFFWCVIISPCVYN